MTKVMLMDLDSTAVKYVEAMTERLNKLRSPGEPEITYEHDLHRPEYINQRRKLVQQSPGFWRNLEKNEAGFDVLGMGIDIGYTPHILTKGPKDCPSAWSEKLEWRNKHLPDVKLTLSEDKSLVYGRVLIEDWPEYYLPWLEHRPRGLVVIIDHPWNRKFDHPQAIRYTGDNKAEVREALLGAYNI